MFWLLMCEGWLFLFIFNVLFNKIKERRGIIKIILNGEKMLEKDEIVDNFYNIGW